MDAMTPANVLAAMPPEPPKPITHDVTIVTTKKLAQAKVIGVPPEEFGIERGARNIRDCNYCFHEVVTKTRAQLISEGFDASQINALTDYSGVTEFETTARDTVEEHMFNTAGTNASASPVKVTEHYVRMDYEGNGRPCLYQVVTGGDQGDVLKRDGKPCITPFDAVPLASWTPIPVPHRFFGRSIADLVMPIQREKTAMKRGALDNLYLHNNPRVEVPKRAAGANTLDDLLVSRPGGIVRTEEGGLLNWQVVPDITSSIYPMMQYLDDSLERKTGLSRQSQGLDANALQNQSATAVAQVFSASQMSLKLVARHLAEGVKDLCGLLHATIKKHGQEKQTVRLRNTWVPVDPRDWKTRNDMTVNVGLGNGGKAQQFQQTMALGAAQEKLLLAGKTNIVDDTKLFNTASELSKLLGHKNADKFFNDPQAKDPQTGQPLYPPAPPPMDPKVQIEQIKAQNDQVALQHKAELEQQQAQIKAQQDADKAKLDAFHQQIKLEGELQLAREKAQLEKEMALIDAALKEKADQRQHELHQQKMVHAQQAHEHTLTQSAQAHQSTMEQKTAPTKMKTEAVKGVSEKVDANTQALHALVEKMGRPRKVVRDKAGKLLGVE